MDNDSTSPGAADGGTPSAEQLYNDALQAADLNAAADDTPQAATDAVEESTAAAAADEELRHEMTMGFLGGTRTEEEPGTRSGTSQQG